MFSSGPSRLGGIGVGPGQILKPMIKKFRLYSEPGALRAIAYFRKPRAFMLSQP